MSADTKTGFSAATGSVPGQAVAEPPRPATSQDSTMTQKMVAASAGSIITGSVVTPFDVVRVRMQNQDFLARQASTTTASTPSMPRITGTWSGMRTIAQYEGFTTLFRGLSLMLVMAVPSNVGYFVGYEYLRDHLPLESEALRPLVAGGVARALVASVSSPVELLRTRLQTYSGPPGASRGEAFKVVLAGVRGMVRSEGVASLWRGLVLTLYRDVPFSGIYWMSVELVKRRLARTAYFQRHPEHSLVQSFVAGVTGGVTAAVFTAPFDVGKTRRQVAGAQGSRSAGVGTMKMLMEIVRTEGVGALYVGAVPRILKVAPASALMISTYDTVKKLYA